MSEEKILCVREIIWEGSVLRQKLLIRKGDVDVEEWRPVASEPVSDEEQEFWRNINWNRTNLDIAKELRHSIGYISQKRSVFGFRSYKHSRLDWEGADWSLSCSQIAKQFGRAISTVTAAKRARGIPPLPPGGNKNRKIDPEKLNNVDWEWETDARIGERLGVTRERVRQIRISLQKPDCKIKGSGKGHESTKWLLQNQEKVKGMYAHDIVRMMPGASQLPSKFRILRKSGVEYKPGRAWKFSESGKYPLNWNLPTKWLGLVWGFPYHHISQRRMITNAGSPKWQGGGFSRYVNDPEFISTLESEIKVAQERGVAVDMDRIKAEIQTQKLRVESICAKRKSTAQSPQEPNQVT